MLRRESEMKAKWVSTGLAIASWTIIALAVFEIGMPPLFLVPVIAVVLGGWTLYAVDAWRGK